MRRKNGTALVKNEELVLATALHLFNAGETEFHGYRLNQVLRDRDRPLVASTLYRVLARLEDRQLVSSSWMQRPGSDQWRRVHELTSSGIEAATEVVRKLEAAALEARPAW